MSHPTRPQSVADLHRRLCVSAKCEYADRLDYRDPYVGCPNGHFYPLFANRSDLGKKTPPKQKLKSPTLGQMVVNFNEAVKEWMEAGLPVVSEVQYSDRLRVCRGCEFWEENARLGLGKCTHPQCGCTKFKLWLGTSRCPVKKWKESPRRCR